MQNNKLKIFLLAILTALFLRAFVIESFVVRGSSMSPSILSGDYVFVNRLSYIFGEPERGDVVVTLTRDGQRVIKRVMGMPWEVIKTASGKETNIDPQEYFVLGDNAAESVDSNDFGFVDKWDIKGRVFGAIRLKELKYIDF